MMSPQIFFKIATAFYGLSLAIAFFPGHRPWAMRLLLLPAIVTNAASVALRYESAWPMMPMVLGPVALPLCLGIATLFIGQNEGPTPFRRLIPALTWGLALAAVCFPKDFYLPFLKSGTLFSHLFLLFGVVGKVCFLISAAWAVTGLRKNRDINGEAETPSTKTPGIDKPPTVSPGFHAGRSPLARSLAWTVWGFAFWTLSMFAGELWSYLGWGTPVVWDDPAITNTMAIWFFYICLLHLHLTKTWTPRGRAYYAATGVLVILGLSSIPDLGPFRWPL